LFLRAKIVAAQTPGQAAGTGTIQRLLAHPPSDPAEPDTEKVPFNPRFSYTYHEKLGAKTYTWIVLTEKEPPITALLKAKDRGAERVAWCKKESAVPDNGAARQRCQPIGDGL